MPDVVIKKTSVFLTTDLQNIYIYLYITRRISTKNGFSKSTVPYYWNTSDSASFILSKNRYLVLAI